MNIVAIIPARGGSKGISNKNITDFCGKPLIRWSIELALNTPEISSVWVSSDSELILSVSEELGARPIIRPDEISGDLATSESAWKHAIEYITDTEGEPVDFVIAIQATSPLRTPTDFSKAIEVMVSEQLDSLFSATPIEDFFIWERNKSGEMRSQNYDYKNRKRRQDIAQQFVENGSFYIFKPEILFNENNRLGGKIGMYLMDHWQLFEIDTIDDLRFCETLMKEYVIK